MVLIQRYINTKLVFIIDYEKKKIQTKTRQLPLQLNQVRMLTEYITNGIEEFNWRVAQLHAVAVRLSCTWFRTSDSKLWLQLLTRKVVSERIYSI